jgi:outer membrane biosynthesis protein TonB
MNLLRCTGLLIVVLLSACDAQETPVPKPRTEAATQSPAPAADPAPSPPAVRSTADAPSESVVSPGPDKKVPPAHDMPATVPVVPVVAGKQPVDKDRVVGKKPSAEASGEKKPNQAKPPSRREVAAQKRKEKQTSKEVRNTRLAPPKLDLSLPPELVQELEPPAKVIPARRKPILPPMFDSDSSSSDAGPFELNGRLLSNEMQLQMRNDSRRDVEGAALDFKFKQ